VRAVRRIAIVLALLLAVGVGVLYWRLDSIAETAIERGGSSALGVPTSVTAVLLRPFAGAFSVLGLDIANPPDYEGAFLQVGRIHLDVDMGTLLQPTIVAPELAISGVEVMLERRPRSSNYDTILAASGGAGAGAEPAPPADDGAAAKQFVVQSLVIRDVTARIRLVALRGVEGAGREVVVRIPEIALENVGSRTEGGVVAGQLLRMVVGAVLQAVAREAPQLPVDLAGELRARLGQFGSLPLALKGDVVTSTQDLAKGALEGVGEAVRQPEKVLEDPGKAAGEAAESLKEGGRKALRGLMGGGEESESEGEGGG